MFNNQQSSRASPTSLRPPIIRIKDPPIIKITWLYREKLFHQFHLSTISFYICIPTVYMAWQLWAYQIDEDLYVFLQCTGLALGKTFCLVKIFYGMSHYNLSLCDCMYSFLGYHGKDFKDSLVKKYVPCMSTIIITAWVTSLPFTVKWVMECLHLPGILEANGTLFTTILSEEGEKRKQSLLAFPGEVLPPYISMSPFGSSMALWCIRQPEVLS